MKLSHNVKARSPISDEQIIELYWMRDEKAIDETDFKYRKYLYTVAYNIIHNNTDAEECLNDTYLNTWNAIPPTRPNMLKAFLTVIMRRIAINRYHNKSKKSSIPSELTVSLYELRDLISDTDSVDSEFDAAHLGKIISNHIRSLSERQRFIFMSRYYIADPIDVIAKTLDLSRSMVNKELSAIRASLKEKLESEGYFI